MYVYEEFDKGCYTVGHYRPNGDWVSESDHSTKAGAAARVAYLNGERNELPRSIQEALNSGDGFYRP